MGLIKVSINKNCTIRCGTMMILTLSNSKLSNQLYWHKTKPDRSLSCALTRRRPLSHPAAVTSTCGNKKPVEFKAARRSINTSYVKKQTNSCHREEKQHGLMGTLRKYVAPSAGHSPLDSVCALDSLPQFCKCPSPKDMLGPPPADKQRTHSYQQRKI